MLKIIIIIKEDKKAGGRWLEDIGKIGGMESTAVRYVKHTLHTLLKHLKSK